MYNNFMRGLIPLLLLIYISGFFSCAEDDGLIIVSGNVYNNITDEPIQNLQIRTELDRCGLSGFQNCEPNNRNEPSDVDGFYRIAFRVDCPHEFLPKLSLELKDQFPYGDFIVEEGSGDYMYTNCHDNILLYKGNNYTLNVYYQPQMLLRLSPINIPSLELEKIEIPDYDIELNGLIDAGISKILNIESYIGSFDVHLTYKNGEIVSRNIKYNYHADHIISLEIEN